jgi:hypothetical protein
LLPQIIILSKSVPFNPENDNASLIEFFGNEESDLIREYLSSLVEKIILSSINTAHPEHFSKVKDPRVVNRCEHRLIDIIVIAVCATICRCDESWEQVEEFGNIKKDWFQKFLELPNGIPSHDTFRRVFLLINPVELQSSFFDWANSFRNILTGETIAIDGKASRGSRDIGLNKKAIYTVSAWAVENQLVLGQVKVAEKSNEITAIPKLLELLDVSGCTVTIDAMGTQKAIAKDIISYCMIVW